MKSRLIACGLQVLLVFLALAGGASAQSDLRPLLDRLDRLERDLGTVQRHVYGGGADKTVVTSPLVRDDAPMPAAGMALPTDLAARLEVRLSQLENELRRLTGQIEEAHFAANQLGSRLDRALADIEFRLKEVEGNLQPAGNLPGTPPTAQLKDEGLGRIAALGPQVLGTIPLGEGRNAPATSTAEPSTVPQRAISKTPKEHYDHALKLLRSDYAAAEVALVSFLEAWPDDQLAGNAQYWLGETYYVRNEFDKAAVAFLKVYQKYGKSPKAPDSLLKLGLSLTGLGQQKEACAAFSKLAVDFPDAPDQVKRRAEMERQKLSCR